MGILAGKPVDAWRGHGSDRGNDPLQTRGWHGARHRWPCPRLKTAPFGAWLLPLAALGAKLVALGFCLNFALLALPAPAEVLRIATWNSDLERKGPGLLLRDIVSGKDVQIEAGLKVLASLDADVLLLTGFDYDYDAVAAHQYAARLAQLGCDYRYLLALRPNRGLPSGLDLDLDTRLGGPGDAQGWGWFSGQSGMLLLSRLPIDTAGIQDFSSFLWSDLPNALLPETMTPEARAVQRLSTTGHWQVPLLRPEGQRLTVMAWHATAPVFDGPEDRNGRRNHDETAFWLALLDGRLPFAPPSGDFVLLGTANLDPADGEGRPAAIKALLAHSALQDPAPRAPWVSADPGQSGDPALDTAVFDGIGGLRVSVILPGRDLAISGAGILRRAPQAPLAADLQAASRHFPIFVDLELADTPP